MVRFICLQLVLMVLTQGTLAEVSVEGCYTRRMVLPGSSEEAVRWDAGYVEAFLVNKSESTEEISELLVNGVLVRGRGRTAGGVTTASKMVYGCLVDPPRLPPGYFSRVVVKLKQPLEGEARLKVVTEGGQATEAEIAPWRPRAITYVAFSDDLSKTYVYLANRTDEILLATDLRVQEGGKAPCSMSLDVRLDPGNKRCVVVPFHEPLEVGTRLSVTVYGAGKRLDDAICQVFAGFPIEQESFQGHVLMQCPTHLHGTWDEAMAKLAGLVEAAGVPRDVRPSSTTIHICKNQANEGIPLFSGVSDRVRFNTFLRFVSGAWGRTVSDSLAPLSWGDIVKCACEPRPFDAVVAIENLDDSSHRQRVVLARGLLDSLAAGAKGLYLRGGSRSVAGGLLDSVEAVKGMLRISEPIDLKITSSDGDVSCRAHLVGDEGLLLFVVRRELRDPTAVFRDIALALEDKVELDLHRGVRVEDGTYSPCELQETDGRININVGRLDIGTMVVLEREGSRRDASSKGLE